MLQERNAEIDSLRAAGPAIEDEDAKYTIIHMVDNPVTRGVEASRAILAKANGQGAPDSGAEMAPTSAEPTTAAGEKFAELLQEREALGKKLNAVTRKTTAMGKIFQDQVAEYKEVVKRLTGYEIELVGGGVGVKNAGVRYKVQSIYAANENDYFLFEVKKSGQVVQNVQMLSTDFTNEWTDEMECTSSYVATVAAGDAAILRWLCAATTFSLVASERPC